MSPEQELQLRSKYYAKASAEHVERAMLSEQAKDVVSLEEAVIKVSRESLVSTLKNLNTLHSDNKISEADKEIEMGLAKADQITVESEAKAKIIAVHPKWTKIQSENLRNAVNGAEKSTVDGAGAFGKFLGRTFAAPIQAVSAAIDGVKKGSEARLG